MKFEIFRDYFELGLQRISAALDSNHELASLVGIKVTKDAVVMSVQGDNLACQVKLDAKEDGDKILKIKEPGSASVPGKMLIDAVSSLEGKASVSVEFEPITETAEKAEEDDDEKSSGLLSIQSIEKKPEGVSLACVARDVNVKIPDPDPSLVMDSTNFKEYYKKVGVSAGKANMAAMYANVSITAEGDSVAMVTTNSQQISRSEFKADVKKKLSALLPYEILAKAVGMLSSDPKDAVSLQLSDNQPVVAFLYQPLSFLKKANGEARYKVTSISDAFPNVERVLKKLNFMVWGRINRQAMEKVMKSFDLFDQVRTRMELSASNSEIGLYKDADKGKAKRYIPVADLTYEEGEQDLEMDISSRHLSQGISSAMGDDIILRLSGASTMAKLELGAIQEDGKSEGSLDLYFQPFK